MRFITVISALFATALATPLVKRQVGISGKADYWTPNPGTSSVCNKTAEEHIGFFQGPPLEYVLNNACAAMMPKCAYADRSADLFCIQTIDFALSGPKSTVQSVNVQNRSGNKISGWKLKFTVTPAPQPANTAGVFWTIQDCYGYFAHLLEKSEALGGCHADSGSSTGNLTAGAGDLLAGTKFDISLVSGV